MFLIQFTLPVLSYFEVLDTGECLRQACSPVRSISWSSFPYDNTKITFQQWNLTRGRESCIMTKWSSKVLVLFRKSGYMYVLIHKNSLRLSLKLKRLSKYYWFFRVQDELCSPNREICMWYHVYRITGTVKSFPVSQYILWSDTCSQKWNIDSLPFFFFKAGLNVEHIFRKVAVVTVPTQFLQFFYSGAVGSMYTADLPAFLATSGKASYRITEDFNARTLWSIWLPV